MTYHYKGDKHEKRMYFCKRCRGLFNEHERPIGKKMEMWDGYHTHLCEKCAKKEQSEKA